MNIERYLMFETLMRLAAAVLVAGGVMLPVSNASAQHAHKSMVIRDGQIVPADGSPHRNWARTVYHRPMMHRGHYAPRQFGHRSHTIRWKVTTRYRYRFHYSASHSRPAWHRVAGKRHCWSPRCRVARSAPSCRVRVAGPASCVTTPVRTCVTSPCVTGNPRAAQCTAIGGVNFVRVGATFHCLNALGQRLRPDGSVVGGVAKATPITVPAIPAVVDQPEAACKAAGGVKFFADATGMNRCLDKDGNRLRRMPDGTVVKVSI